MDYEAVAKLTCGCFICRCDLGLEVMGTTESWKNSESRDAIIAARHRMYGATDPSWKDCRQEAIAGVLKLAYELGCHDAAPFA
jgi:hypothetical protein